MSGMANYAYGQRPPDLSAAELGLGWLRGVRHLKSLSATGSYWHVHSDIQLLYCIKGEFSYEFRDLPPEVLTAGHFIVIPAGKEHRHLQAIDPAGHRIELLVSERPSPRARFGLFPPSVTAALVSQLTDRICMPIPCSRELAALFVELDALAAAGGSDPNPIALARTLASLILQRCVRSAPALPAAKDGGRLIREAVGWLETHAAEPIRMDRLVAYMGYSRSRLFELFRAETGLSPADYLARYRIKRARKMLETSDRPVAEIARSCGFSSPQYFNAAFKKMTGASPAVWRKRARNQHAGAISERGA